MAANNTLAPFGIGPQGQDGMFSGFAAKGGELLQNPNFLKALAGIGAGLDPQGAGGAIGNATIGMIESQAAGEAAGKQADLQDKRFQQMITMLGGKVDFDEQGKVKSITGNSKLTPEMMQQYAGALGGGGTQGQPEQTKQSSGLGSLEEPTTQATSGTNDVETWLDNFIQQFGLGGM